MRRIERKELPKFYEAIASKMAFYLPIKKGLEVGFFRYQTGAKVSLETLKTARSPKDLFFPQSEDLMKFKTEGKNIQVIDVRKENEPFVVFGVKGCDNKAFEVLDKVFLADPVDTYYQGRREKGIIVTLACSRPEESCFCSVFGIDATAPKGDVTTWLGETYLYLQPNTQKGEEWLSSFESLTENGGEDEVATQREQTKKILSKLPFASLDLSRFKKENLLELFESKEWESLSESCIGCGTCTFVCPTCQCYDVRDFKTNEGVIRYRCWDSCMYSDFTLMAHGNSRTTQMQRYRQRFMHKLVYYPSQHGGMYSCVGCGRCVDKCPQNLNIVKVIKALGGKK